MSREACAAARAPKQTAASRPSAESQRRCACGGLVGPEGECAACRQKRLAAAAGAPPGPGRGEGARAATAGHDFTRVPLRPASGGSAEPRLEVGKRGDPYEREAEEMAERVLRMGAPRPPQERPPSPMVHAHAATGLAPAMSPRAASWIRTGRGAGNPLPAATRAFFEPRFGHDFGRVRIHADAAAGAAATALGARAFTVGRDIAFAPGTFDPHTPGGQRLLAHELTHVVQEVPHVARDGDGEDEGCETGRQEGEGAVAGEGEAQEYYIYASWRAGDTVDSYYARAFPAWIRWRFGDLPADARARILRLMNTARRQVNPDVTPRPQCQYITSLDQTLLRAITQVATRARAAQEAERREAEAGLGSGTPTATDAAELGALEGGGGDAAAVEGAVPEGAEGGGSPEAVVEPGQTPVPALGSEFEAGAGPAANAAALPAEIEGPDFGAVHGISTYTMRLQYWPAGLDTLSQVVEAMNWVDYHWEMYDVTALVRGGLSQQAVQAERRQEAVSEEAEVGAMEATGRRAEHTVEDLGADARQSATDLANPIDATNGGSAADVVTGVWANTTALQLLPVSAIVAAGGFSLGALADLLGGTFQEREIPLPDQPSYMLIRCIAQPSPQGPNDEIRRGPSVATKVVEVQRPERLAQEALEQPEADIATMELQLALARDETERRRIQQRIDDYRFATSGDQVAVLERALAQKTAERDAAVGFQRRELDRQVEALTERLTLARDQRTDFAAATHVYRPRAMFASQVTGETYPLLLQLFELPQAGGSYRFAIGDITDPNGEMFERSGATRTAAVWNVLRHFAGHNGYGRGRIAVRLPEELQVDVREDVLNNQPRDVELARQRINDLVAVLIILGLFVPGVGQVAAVLGAAVAAERLAERWRNHTLRFDAATVSDLVSLLGAAAQGAQVLGGLRVVQAEGRFLLVASSGDEALVRAAAASLRTAQTAERVAEIAGHVANYGGVLWGDLVTLNDMMELSQRELAGTITHAEARRQRASLLAAAVRDNTLSFLPGPEPSRRADTPADTVRPATETAGPRQGEPPVAADAPTVPAQGEARVGVEGTAEPRRAGDETPPPERVDEAELRARAQAGGEADAQPGERVVAHATTADGLHLITVLADGRIFRCSRNCGEIRAHFGDFLGEQADPARQPEADRLSAELRDLEDGAAAATTAAERQAIADATAALEPQIRSFTAETLSPELGGVRPDRVANLLEAFTPDEVRQLRATLGQDLFGHVAGRDPSFIRELGRVWDLTDGDAVARADLIATLELTRRGHAPADVAVAFRELAQFLDQYGDRVRGAMITRFREAFSRRGGPAQAQAEIALARDLLEGRTPLGAGARLEAIAQRPGEGERTPEFRVRTPEGGPRLTEVKRVGAEGGELGRTGFGNNLNSAVGQIIGEARRGGAGDTEGFIRIDARHTTGTTLSEADMVDLASRALRSPRPAPDDPTATVRGVDHVRWVEVLFVEGGQQRRLLLEIREGVVTVAAREGGLGAAPPRSAASPR